MYLLVLNIKEVDHDLLPEKLKSLGVKGRVGMWIQSFLKNRYQQVLVDGQLSSIFTLISGVPQGSVLGPVLFLIFISDISESIESDIFIYVDDTKAVKNIKSVEDVIKLQEDLSKLHEWSVKNKMVYRRKVCYYKIWKRYRNERIYILFFW